MIKNYKIFTESLLDKLEGPSEDDVLDKLKNLSPSDLLIKSAEIGLLSGIIEAIRMGVNINFNNDIALRYAALNGFLDIVKYLVENGADLNKYINIIFITACERDYFDLVKYLVQKGADISQNNYYGLKYARYKGYTDIVDYLEKFMKENGIKESLLNKLEGPSEEEVWKSFGYEKTFDTYRDFLDYIFSDLVVIKNPNYPNCFFYTKNDKILFEVDPNNHRIYIDYFDIWIILDKIFNEDDNRIRFILNEEIHNRFGIYNGFDILHMSNLVNSRWWWNEKNHRDYKQFNESLLNKLEGPSEEEFHKKFLSDELSPYKYLNTCQKNNITPLPKDIILNKIYGKTFENTIEYFDFLIQDIKNISPTPKNIFTPFIKFGKDGKVIIVYDKHKNLIYFNNEIMNILILVFKSSCNELIKPLNKFIKDKLKIDTNVKIDFNYIPLSWEY